MRVDEGEDHEEEERCAGEESEDPAEGREGEVGLEEPVCSVEACLPDAVEER